MMGVGIGSANSVPQPLFFSGAVQICALSPLLLG